MRLLTHPTRSDPILAMYYPIVVVDVDQLLLRAALIEEVVPGLIVLRVRKRDVLQVLEDDVDASHRYLYGLVVEAQVVIVEHRSRQLELVSDQFLGLLAREKTTVV